MMDRFGQLKQTLHRAADDLITVFERLRSISEAGAAAFDEWETTCRRVKRQLDEDVFRVAVVGAIKSGKSTFVNSLIHADHLKRGAGVITSIVTRVRTGSRTKATLFFKSWDDVNSEIEQATVLFPNAAWRTEKRSFDIRREKDRQDLETALAQLGSDVLIKNDARDANSVLLSSYLRGYPVVKDLVGPEPEIREYAGDRFLEHRPFVADETLSVYLQDIELTIAGIDLDPSIEIADCQGSDSPNPFHLSMIEDYLSETHLIVYVVSSRTGLRQADLKILNIIKKMGILHNILFIVNCDFSEHEGLADLEALVARITEEAALIKTDPPVYAFSALYTLFSQRREALGEKDRLRMAQWESDAAMVAFSEQQRERFSSAFDRKLTAERLSLLLKNNVQRLGVLTDAAADWIRLNRDLLGQDASGAAKIIASMTRHQERMGQIRSMVRSTLGGGIAKLKKELKAEVDRFFDPRTGTVVGGIQEFIRNYQLNFGDYEAHLTSTGFSGTLYLVFQEFRQALNGYLAETVNPGVVRFVREKEEMIKAVLESVAEPYDAMIRDAIAEHNRALVETGIERADRSEGLTLTLPEMESIRRLAGLTLPPAAAQLRYSAKIRTEAVMRLGFYTLIKAVKKLLKKPLQNRREEALFALRDGFQRIKRETERSVLFHFKDYRENIKFQFLFKITDAASGHLQEILMERFQVYATDLTTLVSLAHREQSEKEQALSELTDLERRTNAVGRSVDAMRVQINTGPANPHRA